jgi:hypothetical protein
VIHYAPSVFSDKPFCRVCQRRGQPLTFTRAGHVCAGCAVEIGRFILRAPAAVLAKFWGVGWYGTAEAPRQRVPVSNKDKLPVHLDLAIGYREVGLERDSLEEAAVVLASNPDGDLMVKALEIVFDGSLAPPALADRLSKIIFES